jgi:hypothetical protein
MKANVSLRLQSRSGGKREWERTEQKRRLYPGARKRTEGLAIFLAAGLSALASPAFAQSPPLSGNASGPEQPTPMKPTVPDSKVRITLRINNYAQFDRAVLTHSEDVATVIFRRAGVNVIWIDCSLYVASIDKSPACRQPMNRAEFAVRIIDRSWRQKSLAEFDGTGLALPCTRDLVGCTVYIFYDPISQWAEDRDISASAVLGHAIAHEVGHLLLGTDSHARAGIMRGLWTHADLRTMARTALEFTPEQSARIRATLRASE